MTALLKKDDKNGGVAETKETFISTSKTFLRCFSDEIKWIYNSSQHRSVFPNVDKNKFSKKQFKWTLDAPNQLFTSSSAELWTLDWTWPPLSVEMNHALPKWRSRWRHGNQKTWPWLIDRPGSTVSVNQTISNSRNWGQKKFPIQPGPSGDYFWRWQSWVVSSKEEIFLTISVFVVAAFRRRSTVYIFAS